jgi:hypothetical protein
VEVNPGRLIPFVAGVLLGGYGLWALFSGRVISTWGQMAQRPSIFYWVVTLALLLLGGLNLFMALRPQGR